MKLGELLCENGSVSRAQLSQALSLQHQHGSRLGEIMIGEGFVDYRSLYRAIAGRHALPFIDLLADPPEPALLDPRDAETYLRLGAIPWRLSKKRLQIAATDLSETTRRWATDRFGPEIDFVITSPFDIRRTVEHHFGPSFEEASRLQLWNTAPHASARITLDRVQKPLFTALFALSIACLAWAPLYSALAFIALCHVAYTLTMLFKCVIFTAGRTAPQTHTTRDPLPDHALPLYTILIPMHREAASLPGMLAALQAMDYPQSKLDIKLVLEADDTETLAAAAAQKMRYHFEIIRVPPSQPRTKPKACNYALRFARGEYVTIFDADDRPDPQQLRKAVEAFRTLPQSVVCLQGRLSYYNAGDNLLTRFFALEYTMLFRFMLYGLERFSIPLPLGGTSNHIALARIRALGEWDPYNVTEDADLGIRLSAAGFETRMLDSDTMEEAPIRVLPWIKQRSRWIKGYMQTWLVHMRKPRALLATLGWKGFIGFQLFIGLSCFTFLTAPVVWTLSALWISDAVAWHEVSFPGWLATLTFINLILNFATHWYMAFGCLTSLRPQVGMRATAVLYPFYMALHSIASYRALWQLFHNPHFWDKTTHGLTRAENV